MDEQVEKLVKSRGIIVLPEEIDHDTYAMLLEGLVIARVERPRQPVILYCRGDGGCSRSALAMVDLIREHGNVIGMLPGEANSSHVTVWAGCTERYVYPHAAIGLHKVAYYEMNSRMDSKSAQLIGREFEQTERKVATLLAEISNKDADHWFDVMQTTGSSGVTQFDAEEIIAMEMAKPIDTFDYPFS